MTATAAVNAEVAGDFYNPAIVATYFGMLLMISLCTAALDCLLPTGVPSFLRSRTAISLLASRPCDLLLLAGCLMEFGRSYFSADNIVNLITMSGRVAFLDWLSATVLCTLFPAWRYRQDRAAGAALSSLEVRGKAGVCGGDLQSGSMPFLRIVWFWFGTLILSGMF